MVKAYNIYSTTGTVEPIINALGRSNGDFFRLIYSCVCMCELLTCAQLHQYVQYSFFCLQNGSFREYELRYFLNHTLYSHLRVVLFYNVSLRVLLTRRYVEIDTHIDAGAIICTNEICGLLFVYLGVKNW